MPFIACVCHKGLLLVFHLEGFPIRPPPPSPQPNNSSSSSHKCFAHVVPQRAPSLGAEGKGGPSCFPSKVFQGVSNPSPQSHHSPSSPYPKESGLERNPPPHRGRTLLLRRCQGQGREVRLVISRLLPLQTPASPIQPQRLLFLPAQLSFLPPPPHPSASQCPTSVVATLLLRCLLNSRLCFHSFVRTFPSVSAAGGLSAARVPVGG